MKRFNEDIRWVTEKEAASITGLSLATLRAHRFKRIGIPYSKVGKSIRYCVQEIENFMLQHRIAPEA